MRGNEFLCHENLDLGQKQYIWGVARVYSVAHMMELKQRQYQSLLDYEFNRRMQNKDLKEHERIKEWKDYERYCKFIKRYEQVGFERLISQKVRREGRHGMLSSAATGLVFWHKFLCLKV